MKRAMKYTLGAVAVLVVAGGVAVWWMTSLNPDPNELDIGAKVPPVVVLDPDGEPFSLAAFAAGGFPVVVFYRGHW